jgi:hypothetical protein
MFTFCRFRLNTNNHKLPVDHGRWNNIPRELRIRNLCNTDLRDEVLTEFLSHCSLMKYWFNHTYERPHSFEILSTWFSHENWQLLFWINLNWKIILISSTIGIYLPFVALGWITINYLLNTEDGKTYLGNSEFVIYVFHWYIL